MLKFVEKHIQFMKNTRFKIAIFSILLFAICLLSSCKIGCGCPMH